MLELENNQKPLVMEITVLSAQGLKKNSSFPFSHRLRPFITIMTTPPTTWNTIADGDKQCHVYTTKVDDQGGVNPTWGDKFRVPLETSFISNRYSCIYLQLYTKRLIAGQRQLGWCQIPVTDFTSPPMGSVRHLRYRLRDRDGTRGQGVINVAIKLEGNVSVASQVRPAESAVLGTCQTVIGIPVTPRVTECLGFCQGQLGVTWKADKWLTSGQKVNPDFIKQIKRFAPR